MTVARVLVPSIALALVLATLSAAPAAAQSAPPAAPATPGALRLDPPAVCDDCPGWNAPREPFKMFGNTYFVGPAGVSALLITSDQGHILVDAGLQQSAAVIDANIRALGFKTSDIKLILTSHGHVDHIGGVHALQRHARATVLASPSTAQALSIGTTVPDDPQFAPSPSWMDFPKVENVRVVKDGETIRLGPVAVTAHITPGHTPGATAWTWDSCEGSRCLHMVYADSLSAISNQTYRFSDHPDYVERFRAGIAAMAALPCDMMTSTHPVASNMDAKLKDRVARKAAPGSANDPFVDPGACRAYAAAAAKGLDQRLAKEKAQH
jgi:metallo-beta-lactamase class B